VHPVIGWPVERLLLHLDSASDQVAIVSPSAKLRRQVAELVSQRYNAQVSDPPTFGNVEQFWPAQLTVWLKVPAQPRAAEASTSKSHPLPYAAAPFPKLSILLDGDSDAANIPKSQWSAVVRRPGRGPTLRLQESEAATFHMEISAAIEAVWPDLGP
jgi:hypothetical protein